MLNKKSKYILTLVLLLFPSSIVYAAWSEPTQAPPGGNAPVPVYSEGPGQILNGTLSVDPSGTNANPLIVGNPTLPLIANTAITAAGTVNGIQGNSVGNALFGNLTANGAGGGRAIYGLAVDAGDYGLYTSGGLGLGIASGDIFYLQQNAGIAWPRESDGASLYGVHVNNSGELRLFGHGAGINFFDQNSTSRLTVSEAGVVNVATGGSLTVNTTPVCLQTGAGCPAITTPDLQAVTTAGSFTTNGLDLRGAIANSIGDLVVNDWADIQWGLKNSTANNSGHVYVSDTLQVDTSDTANAALLLTKAAAKPAFSVLPWNSEVYLSAGIYYKNNAWVQQSDTNDNLLFVLDPGGGARWYASNNGSGSWNVASDQQLWNPGGNWSGLVQSTKAGDSYFTGGNLAIGSTAPGAYKLHVTGNAYITGNLTVNGVFSAGADVAEEFATPRALEPGTVVVMGSSGYKSAEPATQEYDQSVVGVVSDNASFTMGRIDSPNKSAIAMVGVVKVKVTGYNGAISQGDLLTTSNQAGYAMKAAKPRIGTIIGKALEDFAGQSGSIMALINLQ